VIDLARKHPLPVYFALVYTGSAAALAVLGLPRLDASATQSPYSLAAFPFLVASVAATGIAMTALTAGPAGLLGLWRRLDPRRVPGIAFLVLAVPPAGVLITLLVLDLTVSPAFRPGLQLFGPPIGVVAGLLEELGWTGFAYPRMSARFGPVPGAVLLGVLWGIWHLPVVDSLGAASPHGAMWPAFFLSFVALVTAVRCLICWTYSRTGSVLLAQLIHASFTGTLILLSAPRVNPGQEAVWYAAYAVLLGGTLAIGAVAGRSARPRTAASAAP
jgi:membrane protease YdiL (CAAX protease family)